MRDHDGRAPEPGMSRTLKHLSGLDALFLHLESAEMPMHVGGFHLLELPRGYRGDYYEDVKRLFAARLHLAPALQRRLVALPFDLANPVWVRDDDVDLDYHVRHIVLPKPGSLAQLEAYVARLHSGLLDRSRPLWESYVFEGLADGRVAVYTKLHHAAVDGQAAVELANALFDATPTVREVPPPAFEVEPLPTLRELLTSTARHTVTQLSRFGRLAPTLARGGVRLAASRLLPQRFGGRGGGLPTLARGPRTALNVAITSQRSFVTTAVPLAPIKAAAKALDVTINDIVLAICSGALRGWLAEHGGVPAKPLVAAVPFSVRASGDAASNNQVSMMFAELATQQDDPAARLAAIHASMQSGKEVIGALRTAVPTDFPSLGAPWIVGALAALYSRSRLADRVTPVANVVISNVPGPRVPLYMAGARMVGDWPISIVVHGIALNITVQSYHDAMEFGLLACRRAVPDLASFREYLPLAADEIFALVQRAAPDAAAEAPAKKRAARRRADDARTPAPPRARRPRKARAGTTAR